jgi:two-component sensor histidine kinase
MSRMPSRIVPHLDASEAVALRQALAESEARAHALAAELEEKTAEIRLLHEVAAGVAAALTPGEMLDYIAETAIRVSGTDSASIYVLDDAKGELILRALKDAPRGVVGKLKLKLGEGITGWVARELRPVALEREAYQDARFKDLPDLRDQRFQSFLSVPMIARGQVIGVLNVKTRAPHRYSDKQIRVVSAVAAQAAAAIEGARIHDRMSARETQLSAISEVSKTVASNLYLEEILQLLVAMTARTMNFRICSLMLLDEPRGELVIKATQSKSADYLQKPNLKVGESVAGRAVKEGRVLTIIDVKRAPDYRFPDIAEKEGLCSMICVPLRIKERCLGVLNCYTGRPHVFSQEEVSLLSTLANYAAIAIENAKLMVRSAIIQEMHHRVKNSLQTVASLLCLQMNRPAAGTMEEVLRESISRICSIAAVHDLLSREELDQVNLKRVAETILALSAQSLLRSDHRIATAVEGDDVIVSSGQATSVALILNELVQNAIRHGFETRRAGHLTVCLSVEGSSVRVDVVNDGSALSRDFEERKARSLGLQIVESLARDDLAGRFWMSGNGVTRASIVFPRQPGGANAYDIMAPTRAPVAAR